MSNPVGAIVVHLFNLTLEQHQVGEPNQPTQRTSAQKDTFFYLNIYIVMSIAIGILGILRFFWLYFLAIKASTEIFKNMFFAVLHAPLQWLDAVPTGRIINRFTADFSIIDQRIPLSWILFFTSLLRLFGICIASSVTSIFLIAPSTVLLMLGILIGKRYLTASRPLKRLESTAKSPVFELFHTTLTGISTVRAFQKSQSYVDQMHTHLDRWTMTTFYAALANRWMSFRMALVAACFCISVGAIITFKTSIDAALAGFVLSFVLELSEAIRWTIRCYGDIELDMSTIERANEYMSIVTEPMSGCKPPAAWPASGVIHFDGYEAAYGPDMPLVLKGLSFSVQQNERVGVVGRTGAGKSSLALALFRCLETRAGSIVIDGIDISEITLHDLRARMAIIPQVITHRQHNELELKFVATQDPILFSGTIRSNLDPFDEHTDNEILAALAQVQLAHCESSNALEHCSLDNNFSDLSSPISESGGNLSQGQRQLLSIARAILSRPKIIVFDEATSAIDMVTDALVQRSIREGFTNSTLIVIAHRLSTICDFDKILVLGNGAVAEFGTPKELWEKRGMFWSMCESGGRVEREKLRESIFG
jgi:ABC-type multidrug transport system fused ATPase/permease subunit